MLTSGSISTPECRSGGDDVIERLANPSAGLCQQVKEAEAAMEKQFSQWKKQCVNKLDQSKKGRVDQDIEHVVSLINSRAEFFTTSSCSGRVLLIDAVSTWSPRHFFWFASCQQLVSVLRDECNSSCLVHCSPWKAVRSRRRIASGSSSPITSSQQGTW